ncbi:IQ domain-containing protein IQM2 [Mercurialis annua]|uniref:IQ domain-containing protein IQM2 n=1 Tax=Mercurialis annua TaxID=3986 RepID=UPI00215E6141|nr:IQ domain-containing protein IQM2 [Mercurialis annua]
MGILFSFPFAECGGCENAIESITVKSITFGEHEVKTPARSVSFRSQDLEPLILKSLGSGKMMVEKSVSFKGGELENRMLMQRDPLSNKEKDATSVSVSPSEFRSLIKDVEMIEKSHIFDPSYPKHEAAVKLQKVYKSFRTRRKLADCAVLVEQSWWKLLDFAELKHSSISFFDIEKHETAMSRWSRARTRAAKVGKGLSKNDKARKLALQHWLEAIDPRHRYGHNLHFYYCRWLHSMSREPFFYWLDIGEGKEINLEKCPRPKLQQQCIKYLGPIERMCYEVIVEDGKFIYKQTGEFVQTTTDAKWIFVLSTSMTLYVGQKNKGKFQHSSFLAGGVTIAAGRLIIESGILKAVWPHSGHYRPTEENFKDFLSFLRQNNVDLTNVQTTPVDEEDGSDKIRSSRHLRNHSSEEDLMQTMNDFEIEEINAENLAQDESDDAVLKARKPGRLEIPKTDELLQTIESENQTAGLSGNNASADKYDQDQEDNEVENIPEEAILQRINSKKGTETFQLGRQLSCKWTTGAGPRIGCVRDYPSQLQFRALEQVNLSPRRIFHSRSIGTFSQSISSAMGETIASPLLEKGSLMQRSLPHSITQGWNDINGSSR